MHSAQGRQSTHTIDASDLKLAHYMLNEKNKHRISVNVEATRMQKLDLQHLDKKRRKMQMALNKIRNQTEPIKLESAQLREKIHAQKLRYGRWDSNIEALKPQQEGFRHQLANNLR